MSFSSEDEKNLCGQLKKQDILLSLYTAQRARSRRAYLILREDMRLLCTRGSHVAIASAGSTHQPPAVLRFHGIFPGSGKLFQFYAFVPAEDHLFPKENVYRLKNSHDFKEDFGLLQNDL